MNGRLSTPYPARAAGGFTLIELTVVLFLVALLLGALLGPVSLRLEAERRAETEEYLATVKQALIGFALRNGRLPCPDSDAVPDGEGNGGTVECPTTTPPVAASCSSLDQWLPWADIGVPPTDPYGNTARYGVGAAMVASPEPCPPTVHPAVRPQTADYLTLAATSTRRVDRRIAQGNVRVESQSVAAYVVSFGSNGRASLSTPGFLPAQSDESLNVARDGVGAFTNRPIVREFNRNIAACTDIASTPGTPSCYFDDIVDWIPLTVLQYHLVTAGRLP